MIKYMQKPFLLLISALFIQHSFSQLDPADDVIVKSNYPGVKSFTYRTITTEYITNENDYFLGLTFDTAFYRFSRLSDSFTYKIGKYKDEKATMPYAKGDTLSRIPLTIRFAPNGKVEQLTNWTVFRDLFMAGFSAQVRAGLITSDDFEDAKKTHNNEGFIRRLVMEDINYLFSLFGDTLNTEAEYIRLKTIRSPFSGNDYYFKGSLKVQRPAGTKNTLMFETVNKAGPDEKPLLMAEATEYQKKKLAKGEHASEIHSVGLNSEQSFQYNTAQGKMMVVTLSDVVALDFSSRANIRKYELWDVDSD